MAYTEVSPPYILYKVLDTQPTLGKEPQHLHIKTPDSTMTHSLRLHFFHKICT